MRSRQGRVAVGGLLLAVVLGGCAGQAQTPQSSSSRPPSATSSASSSASSTEPTSPPGPTESAGSTGRPVQTVDLRGDPYADLARDLQGRGVEVWFETDLVARWLEGPAAFDTALTRLADLATLPGVKGFKVADELGYHDGLTSVDQATSFLRAVRTELGSRAPGAEVVVDMVVPELGCLAWTPEGSPSCASQGRAGSPAASEAAVTGYLRAGLVDRLDLSTSLLDDSTYRSWGLSRARAQTEAWAHVRKLGWGELTTLQARKALADAGGYQGTSATARADVHTFVDIPVAAGAGAVDIWTWRQQYDGSTVSLLAPDLADNPLWDQLRRRHRAGVHLLSHITPSQLPDGAAARARECDRVAEVFDAMLVAAGTG